MGMGVKVRVWGDYRTWNSSRSTFNYVGANQKYT